MRLFLKQYINFKQLGLSIRYNKSYHLGQKITNAEDIFNQSIFKAYQQ